MALKAPVTKEINTLGEEKKTHSQQGGSGTLWSNQDEMKRYVFKLKSELDEQKSRVKRVHRDKAEEMKRLQENLDNERQKAIENVSKKLESDKAYELKKLRESVVKQKESELRQVLRLKDEEMRTLKQELQDSRNTTRILELENKRNLNERQRGDTNEQDRRLRNEVAALRNDKRRLEESLRIKTDADFEKAEMIRRMKHEHDTELHRLTRESKRESLKEFRHLRAVSREIEAKNHQLAAKETEMRRLEQEKNSLGDELNLQRKKIPPDGNLSKSNSFKLQRPKDLSASSDFENGAEDRIKKLKMRNSELVAIARKLEGKAKQLQEERDILEKSSELNPEVGNLKKAFARQRAKDLAEHAKLLMNKDQEIDNLKKEAQQNNCSSSFMITENGNVDDLEKIVQQTAKEHLLLEKQLSSKGEVLADEIKEIRSKNLKLSNDNEILQAELCKLQDVEAKHYKTVFEMNQIREEHKKLQHASSEKDKRIYKLELEKQTCVAKNNALQKKNSELSHKVDKLGKLENECATLKAKLETLKNEYDMLRAENNKLQAQVESLSTLKKEVERLEEENLGLQKEKEASVFELEEREREISSLHKAQSEAQKKYDEQVNERDEMIRRLKEQPAQILEKTNMEFHNPSLGIPVLSSTPKTTTFTQTSRPSSPILSPINDYRSEGLQKAEELNNPSEADSPVLDSLHVPDYYATSSSASFDLEKAGTRIDQLAVSDSDETDETESSRRATPDSPSASSDISDYSEEDSDRSASENTSYSADVSHTSDVEEPQRTTREDSKKEVEKAEELQRTTEEDSKKEVEKVEEPQRTTKEDSKKEVKKDEDEEEDVFIGNQMHESPDVEEKLSIFIAKYSYDPMLYSPNENPETELAFQAGDYLYVYGDTDEDGFFVGELMNGERGLVPSNFVERIADEDEAILKESDDKDDGDSEDDSSDEEITLKDEDGKKKVIRPKAFSERRHEMFRTSLDHMLNDQLDDIRESEEEDFGNSSVSEDELGGRKRENKKTEADQNFSDGLDSMDSDPPPPRVPSPSKLSLDRQFTKSALISWQSASLPNEEIQGYNIYVDGRLKTQVKGSKKTNALLEDIDPNETYRLSVRTKSVNGKESPDYEATMVCGPDSRLSPYNLQIVQVTQTSAKVDWVPANSCYDHEVFLDDSLLQCVKSAVSSYTLCDLSPSTLYRVRVRTVVPNHIKLALGKAGTEENFSFDKEFTTCAGGLPEPPVDLRLEQQTAEKIILTWLPVTISPTGYSNGFKVSGYKVYVNGVYCTETDSASLDSVSISTERLRNLGKRHDFTRMRFVVRTQSVLGESTDSNVVEVLSSKGGGSVTESQLSVEQQNSNETEVRTTSDSSAVAEALRATENDINKQIESSSQQISDNVLSDLERRTGTSDELPSSIDLEIQPDDSHSLVDLSPSVATGNTGDNNNNRTNEQKREDFMTATHDLRSTSDELPSSIDLETQPDDSHSLVDLSPSVATGNTGDDNNNRTNEQKRGDFMMATHDLRLDDDRRKLVEPYSAEHAVGQHKEPHSAEESEASSTDNTEEHSEVKEHDIGYGDTTSAFADELPSDGRRKPNVIHYDVDDDTETESCTAESKTETEEESVEIFVDPKITTKENKDGGDVEQVKDSTQTAIAKEDQGLPKTSVTDKQQSESETDTDYDELLSVIDEVDEENLTETSSNSLTEKPGEDIPSNEDPTISSGKFKSVVSNSSKISTSSGSKTRTLSSEDEGFRTDDDVLDLLDDDNDVARDKPREGEGSTGTKEDADRKEPAMINGEHTDNGVLNNTPTETIEVGDLANNRTQTKLNDENQETNSSGTLSDKVETNANTTGDDSNGDTSDSSYPTRTSLNSDSSLSNSDAPPPPDRALDTIIKTLSLPGNRELGSGESEPNDNAYLGSGSEKASEPLSENGRSEPEGGDNLTELVRFFVALYNYDPLSMSPNADGADEELPFTEGDLIKVFGEKDEDGFFWGECKTRQGFVPSNMISEVSIDEAEDLFNEASNNLASFEAINKFPHKQINGHSELDVDVDSEDTGVKDRLSFWENLGNGELEPRKMRALFDYDPVRDSPNVDSEVELMFKTGEIIYIFGDIDDDGFFQGERHGIRGLVPSNFLELVKDDNYDSKENINLRQLLISPTKGSASTSQEQEAVILSPDLPNGALKDQEEPQLQKKKKGIFSKGKRIFKKAFR